MGHKKNKELHKLLSEVGGRHFGRCMRGGKRGRGGNEVDGKS